jgi:hypothetical protein
VCVFRGSPLSLLGNVFYAFRVVLDHFLPELCSFYVLIYCTNISTLVYVLFGFRIRSMRIRTDFGHILHECVRLNWIKSSIYIWAGLGKAGLRYIMFGYFCALDRCAPKYPLRLIGSYRVHLYSSHQVSWLTGSLSFHLDLDFFFKT